MATATAGVLIGVASLLSFVMACQGREYTVGDEEGWTLGYDYQKWAAGKTFYVGDTLVFNAITPEMSMHNVVRVNGTAFAKCVSEPNMGLYESGIDKIVLSAPGNMWFICGIPGHCESGMKLQITVKKAHFHSHHAPSPAPSHRSGGIPASSPADAPADSPASATDSIFLTWLTWLPWH